MLLRRARQEITRYSKQLFNVSTIQSNHSLQFVTPVINRFVDDLLVKFLLAGAHSCLWERPCWKLERNTCSAAELLIHSVINRVQVRAVRDHTYGSINLHKTFSSYSNGIVRISNLCFRSTCHNLSLKCIVFLLDLVSFTNLLIPTAWRKINRTIWQFE